MKRTYVLGLLAAMLLVSCGTTNPSSLSSSSLSSESSIPSSSSESSSSSSFSSSSSSSSSDSSSSSSSSSSGPTTYDTAAYGSYYASCLSWNNGEDLKQKLYNAMHVGFTPVNYDANWNVNRSADEALDNLDMVDQLYSEDDILKTRNKNAAYQLGWDREHCFAKSLIVASPDTSVIGPLTDFHNLYSAWTTANNSRSNKNYGELNGDDVESAESPVGDNHFTDTKFEPASGADKGRVARAIFYMATMYADDTYGLYLREETCGTGEKCHGNLSDLLRWNLNPVDRGEYKHDVRVSSFQNNRNCYVDYPELVDYVFGSKRGLPGELKYLKPTVYDLDASSKDFSNYALNECTYAFTVGDKFSSLGDVGVVETNLDYSIGDEVLDYTVTGLTDGQEFKSKGEGTLTVTIGDESISYPYEVANDPVSSCTYQHLFASGDFKKNNANDNQPNEVTLDGVSWYETRANKSGTTYVASASTKGIQLGSSNSSVGTLTLETKEDMSYLGSTRVKSVYFEGNTASGTTASLSFYVGDTLIGSDTLEYTATGHNTCGVTIDEALEGRVKIVVSGLSKAVWAYRIGVGLE